MSELSREIGEIWARLFDHRPYLNGEIKLMVKEFEERRSDREVENLFSVFEKVTEIKDSQLEKIKKNGDATLPLLNGKLNEALTLFNEIEAFSQKTQVVSEQNLIKNRNERQKDWDQFIDDMNFKCKRIDNAFEEKEEELRDFYADLNHKLSITK